MWNMKYLQWAELFLTTSHLSSSSWSKLVRDNFAEKLWCCCLDSALLEAGLVWGCRGWSLPQHFLQTIRGVRTAACHQVRIQHLLHNLMKMTVLTGASHPLWRSWQMAATMSSTRGHNTLKRAKKWKKAKTWLDVELISLTFLHSFQLRSHESPWQTGCCQFSVGWSKIEQLSVITTS